jgi:hypothetical protein
VKEAFYSEILDKFFISAAELEVEEKKFLNEKAEKEEARKRAAQAAQAELDALNKAKAAQSARKKELAQAIDDADVERQKAYAAYKAAEDEVKRILDESNAKMTAILKDAKERVRVAEDNRFVAIANFNKEFGPYKAFYSDEKARAEYNNILVRLFNWF